MAVTNEEVAVRLSATGGTATAAEVTGVRGAVAGLEAETRRATASTLNWSGAYKQLSPQISSVNRVVDRGAIGLAALTGGAVAWGLKTASSYELSRSALGALLGDVSKGNGLFKQLQTYNLAAPFDFAGIANAEQTLIQFGIAGDKALPVLKGLGDVAAMTSNPTQNLQSMALALGQISSAGVMRAQDMNQLVQAGFPAYRLLAEVTGKTSLQLRKDMETGLTVPAGPFVAQIEAMQGKVLSVYKGGAAKQNDTLYGQWSNFKDLMARNLEAGLRPALPDIKKELPILANSFADAIDRVGPQLPGLVDAAAHLAPALIDMTSAFAGLLGATAPIVEDVADLMGPNGVKALLFTLLGFRALTGTASIITGVATAVRTLAGAEAAEATARGAGGVGGGVVAPGGRSTARSRAVRGGAGILGAVPFAIPFFENAKDAFTGDMGAGEIGNIFGGSVGRAARNAADVGQGVWSLAEQGLHSSPFIGGDMNINIHHPASTVDVQKGVSDGLKQHVKDREDRK